MYNLFAFPGADVEEALVNSLRFENRILSLPPSILDVHRCNNRVLGCSSLSKAGAKSASRTFSPFSLKRVFKNPYLSILTNRRLGVFSRYGSPPFAVPISSACRMDSPPVHTDAVKLTSRFFSASSSTCPLTAANRELVTEQLRSLSTASAREDEDEGELRREMDSSFDAFKVGVDAILDLSSRFSKGSRFHNYLRSGVEAAIELLIDAFDLEPSRADRSGEGVAAEETPAQSASNFSSATPASAASDFAAALPDDPAAQIEAFRIILNQLKFRNRRN